MFKQAERSPTSDASQFKEWKLFPKEKRVQLEIIMLEIDFFNYKICAVANDRNHFHMKIQSEASPTSDASQFKEWKLPS